MVELTNEGKLKILGKLPAELQDIYFEDSGAVLLYLGKKYNLSDDKISLLAKIVGDVVLGILPLPNLASEIANKIAVDQNIASQIAQEINSELFAPVANLLKGAPVPPVQIPNTDRYREPTVGPEVIDLRKTPPPPIQMPVAAAPIPARQWPEPQAMAGGPPSPKPVPPLTFTKPIERPLIEADPHRAPTLTPTLRPPVNDTYREPVEKESEPQFIIRPPGLPPADLPTDVLDLRQDKGEF